MRNTSRLFVAASVVGTLFACVSTVKADYSDPFTSVTLSNTPAPNAWYVDRYAPAGFTASGGTLTESIAGADVQGTSFANFQGRAHDVNTSGPSQTVSIDMFIPATWASAANGDVSAGIWGVGVDSSNAVSAYPIISFRNAADSKPGPGVAGFESFDYEGTGLYTPLASTVNYGAYNNLSFTLTPGVGISYSVNGSLAGFTADPDTVALSSVILNAYNFGSDYSVQYQNLSAVSTPEPASLGLLGAGALGLLAKRRRKA